MKHRRKRWLLINPKYLKIIIIVVSVILIFWAVLAILAATRQESKKQQAVDAFYERGMINIGMRADLGALSTLNEQTGEFEGFEKDVADILISRLFEQDIIVNFVEVNSRTKDAMLRRGDIDIALAASIEKSISGIDYTSSYYADASAFLVPEGYMSTMEGLNGGVIAIVQNTYQAMSGEEKDTTKMDDYLALLKIGATVRVYASYPEAVAALRAGLVNGVCASEVMLKLFGQKGMVILSERFMPNEYCVGVSESLGAFIEAVDDGLRSMQLDGTLDELIRKWNLTNYEELDR